MQQLLCCPLYRVREIKMIGQTASMFGTADQGPRPVMGKTMATRCTCAVQLFDRRTGLPHRVNGTALVIYTRNPEVAVADLLDGRDAAKWDVRIHEIDKAGAP